MAQIKNNCPYCSSPNCKLGMSDFSKKTPKIKELPKKDVDKCLHPWNSIHNDREGFYCWDCKERLKESW